MAPTNVKYVAVEDLKYGGLNSDVGFDFYYPDNYLSKSKLPVFIWLHGGGWTGGDKADDRLVAQKIAERGFIVLNLNYTLAPSISTSLFPQAVIASSAYSSGINDIKAAVELIKLKAKDFHIDLQKISIGGGSAGGHLALMMATTGVTTFNCVISAAGPTDLLSASQYTQFPVTAWIVKSVFGDSVSDLKANSPYYQISNMHARRFYLLHQENDNLVPIDQVRSFLNSARARFGNAIEESLFSDPLPQGIPDRNPSPAQLTHNFEAPVVISAIANFLGNKCY